MLTLCLRKQGVGAKLTKSVINSSSPKEKDYIVWNQEVKGFGCRIFPGEKKTYVFHYRAPLTKKYSYIKIGTHGNLTVEIARGEARKFSGMIAGGIDPKEQRKKEALEEKQSMLFAEFFEIFREKYMRHAYKDAGQKNLGFARLYLLPYFGQENLGEITARDIKNFLESLNHIPTTANRCFSLLSMIFKKAEEWDYLSPKSNPCLGVKKYKENKKQRFLSYPELIKLEEALNQQEKEQPSSYYTVKAILLSLYTGCRKSNILNLKWENVHLKQQYIHLPDTKTGEGACPLSQKAYDLLASLRHQEGNPYVFPGKVPGNPLVEIKTAWRQILKRASIKNFRVHDLRHSFASFSLSQGIDLYTVSKLLGHKNIATTTRYAHLELEHLKKATNIVGQVFK